VIKYKIISGPASEPITTQEAKDWMKVEHSVDDALIDALIQSTREAVERYTGQILFTTTIEEAFDGFPFATQQNPFAAIPLAWGPVQSLTSVNYVIETGSETLLESSKYILDDYARPSCITPAYSSSWPTTQYRINSIKVQYVAGHDDVAAIPQAIKTAILMTLSDAYDKRQDSVRNLPSQAEWLLDKYRIKWY